MTFGYMRKFENDAHFDRDYELLITMGVTHPLLDEPFSDLNLKVLLSKCHPGDKVITPSPARLAASAVQLSAVMNAALKLRLRLDIGEAHHFNFAPDTKYSGAIVNKVGLLYADLERELRGSNSKVSIPTRPIGRPRKTQADIPNIFMKYYQAHKNGAINISEYSRLSGLSRPTIYKYLKMLDGTAKKE